MTQPHSRWIETVIALGIGFGLNLLASAATAAGLFATVRDVSQMTGVAGAMGGLVAAIVGFAAMGLSAETPTERPAHARLVRRAAIEGLFSVIVGAIVASYWAVPAARIASLTEPGDITNVGFGMGVFAWKVAPGVIATAYLLARPQVLFSLAMQKLGIKIVRDGSEP